MISFLWYENSQKVTKKSQNLLKVLPKTVLFRSIALIFSFEKPCYLENRVVREPCKQRSACILRWEVLQKVWKKINKSSASVILSSLPVCVHARAANKCTRAAIHASMTGQVIKPKYNHFIMPRNFITCVALFKRQ